MMPDFCAAYGCSNERNEKNKQKGITFHSFPSDKQRRQSWTIALRRGVKQNVKQTGQLKNLHTHLSGEDQPSLISQSQIISMPLTQLKQREVGCVSGERGEVTGT
ncbi:hypothetical protein UPYG_G00183230 [Umbra pygmaea]|uniref:THAP-type domain-containing protein n=1 Tax=Umbra pygmaea TaxID=75934 RepID=A0ABD0WVJ8_UMBPY